MLYEARYFSRQTRGKYDASHPNISSPIWNRSLYGPAGAHQYDRLAEAMRLDLNAALQSCSIGRYQVMVFNYRMLGYASPSDMWADFCAGERQHVKGFGAYITGAGLLPALRANPPEFVRLAIGYNGTGEHSLGYDTKLEAAWWYYEKHGENAAPSPVAAHARALRPSMIGNAEHGAALLAAAKK